MSPGSSSHSCSGSKWRRIFSGTPVDAGCGRAGAADAPAPPALHLQQEHVVGIEVRPDAAAVAGIGDHQVVEPRIGHEAEARRAARAPPRRAGPGPAPAASSRAAPAAAARAAAAGRGAASSRSPRARTRRDSTSSPAASANSAARAQRRRHAGQRLAHQQRLLLPVAAHELRRRQAAEQRQRERAPCADCAGASGARRLCDHCPMKITAPCVVTLTWRSKTPSAT